MLRKDGRREREKGVTSKSPVSALLNQTLRERRMFLCRAHSLLPQDTLTSANRPVSRSLTELID